MIACLTCEDKDDPKPPEDGIVTFERIIGTAASEYVFGADITSDGGCIVTGWYKESSLDGFWAYLLRTNNVGDTLWLRRYRAPNSIYYHYGSGRSVQQTTDGGFIMVGDTQPDSNRPGDGDFYIVKTDANGDTIWTRTYDRSRTDGASSVKQTSDGGFIVAGLSARYLPSGGGVGYVFRLTSDGSWVWGRTIDEYGGAYAVEVSEDGSCVVAGIGAIATKLDQAGNTVWTKTYGSPYGNEIYAIDKTADGGYILAGNTVLTSGGLSDAYLIRVDANGDTLWTRTYLPSYGADNIRDVTTLPDGGFIFPGYTEYSNIIRTNENGDTLWTRLYGTDYGGVGLGLSKPTSDGGFLFVGGVNINKGDVYLLKTDSLGLVKSKNQ